MSRQTPAYAKQSSPGLTRSASGLLERGNTSCPHLCVQRQAVDTPVHPSAPSLARGVLQSPGQPLDSTTRAFMEPRFGFDFSRVRVHTDDRAAKSAEEISANAYTAGSHIVFGAGQYAPATQGGRDLIAHELTHVTQQASGPVSGKPMGEGMFVSEPSDPFERAADSQGDNLTSLASHNVAKGPAPQQPTIFLQRKHDSKKKRPAQSTNRGKPSSKEAKAPAKKPTPAPKMPDKGQENPPASTELPPELSDKIESRVVPELESDFLQIGRLAAVDSKQELRDFFKPYDDSITVPNEKLLFWGNQLLTVLSKFPTGLTEPKPASGQPSPDVSFSGAGTIAGVAGAVGNSVAHAILDTKSVGEAKQEADLDAEMLAAENLTTDSNAYDHYESHGLELIKQEAALDYRDEQKIEVGTAASKSHGVKKTGAAPPAESARSFDESFYHKHIARLVAIARRHLGVHSKAARDVLAKFRALFKTNLKPLKDKLDSLAEKQKHRRWLAGLAIGGAGGAIIGLTIGGAIGGGWGALAGGLIGAGVGALPGFIGWITSLGHPKETSTMTGLGDKDVKAHDEERRKVEGEDVSEIEQEEGKKAENK